MASPGRRGIWGSPAPTRVIGRLRCTVLCSAAISASNSADGEELDFVDEEDDPGAVVGCGLAEGKEQVGQVRAEVAGVGLALDPFGGEPGAEGAGGVDGELA